MAEKSILVGSDGPFNNVIKTKPPLLYKNIDTVCSEIRHLINRFYFLPNEIRFENILGHHGPAGTL